MITVALAKGALLNDSVQRFAAAGLDFSAVLEPGNRQLMVPTPCGRARALLVRNADVPVYVAYGQAQLGVVGYDVLREHQLPVAQLLDLGFQLGVLLDRLDRLNLLALGGDFLHRHSR